MKNKIFLGVKGVKTIAFLFLSLLMILPLSSCYNKENRKEILKVTTGEITSMRIFLLNFRNGMRSRRARRSASSTRPSTSMR